MLILFQTKECFSGIGMSEGRQYIFKINVIGNGAVGKTSIIRRKGEGVFREDNRDIIGTYFSIITIGNVRLSTWEGLVNPRPVIPSHYGRGAKGIIFVHDASRPTRRRDVLAWLESIYQEVGHMVPIAIVQNKEDLVSGSETEQTERYLETLADVISSKFGVDSFFIKSSAKTGYNIEELFQRFAKVLEDFYRTHQEYNPTEIQWNKWEFVGDILYPQHFTDERELDLSGFGWNIDLSEFAGFKKVEYINLQGSSLSSFDLAQLKLFPNLRTIDLTRNRLKEIDLSPLMDLKEIEIVDVDENGITEIDITPLLAHPARLRVIHAPDTVRTTWARVSSNDMHIMYEPLLSWSRALRLLEGDIRSIVKTQLILSALDLGHFGFIDNDLSELFLSIGPSTDIETVRNQVRAALVEVCANQINNRGLSIGLDIEKALSHHQLAIPVSDVLMNRSDEISATRIPAEHDAQGNLIYNLKSIYLTAYGYEILRALQMPTVIDNERMKRLLQAFMKIGIKPEIIQNSEVPERNHISWELSQFIWDSADMSIWLA